MRRTLLLVIGAACLILGAVLMALTARAQTIQATATPELCVILGLAAAPICTGACLWFDRRIAGSSPRSGAASGYQIGPSPLTVAHAPHDRSGRAAHHTRLIDPATDDLHTTIAQGTD